MRRAVACLTLLASTAYAVDTGEVTLRGYTPEHAAAEVQWEQKFREMPDPAKVRENMRRMSARPHHVGSPYDKDNAEWLVAQLKSYGLDAKIEQFEALFPTPKSRKLELLEPEKFEATLDEPVVKVDLRDTAIADNQLTTLKELPQLKILVLDGTKVSDAGIEALTECNGLERVLPQGVSGAVAFALDWWHLSAKQYELGGLIHEQEPGAAAAWAQARETTLWEQGGAALAAELDRLGCPAGASPAAAARWPEVRNHVWKNRHRTEYPRYRERGWDVGSGPTEAGCKVIGQRLKGAGMRWGEGGAHAMCHVRALYRSEKGQWQAFWDRQFSEPFVQQAI